MLWYYGISPLVALVAYQVANYLRSCSYVPVEEGDAIVVTGAHTGIGKHAALTLAKEGYTVFCGVRKVEHGNELLESAAQLDIDKSKIKPLLLDVTNADHVKAAVEQVTSFVGEDRGLYGLFNNAGVLNAAKEGEGRSVEHMPMDMVRHVFEVNFFGLLRVTQAFLPLIRLRRGRIVTNTSIFGIFVGPFAGAYSGSKSAAEALMDSLRRELLGLGVHVSILEPGFIQTPLFHNAREIFQFQGVGVYAKQEVANVHEFSKLGILVSQSPRVTSKAVVHAMRSRIPKTRYVMGGLSGVFKLCASLPDKWIDNVFLLARRVSAVSITPDELERLFEIGGKEYTL
ncbi:hypothetical protein ACA910_015678 [Epithemia clementina (nom. ined.)]